MYYRISRYGKPRGATTVTDYLDINPVCRYTSLPKARVRVFSRRQNTGCGGGIAGAVVRGKGCKGQQTA
jgi:hypothetical protein